MIPAVAVDAVIALIEAIVEVIQSGSDNDARTEALMKAGERLKAEADRAKFGDS